MMHIHSFSVVKKKELVYVCEIETVSEHKYFLIYKLNIYKFFELGQVKITFSTPVQNKKFDYNQQHHAQSLIKIITVWIHYFF